MPIIPKLKPCNGDYWKSTWKASTFGEALDGWAARDPEGECLVDGESRVSYREMRERVRRLSAHLLSIGVRKGDAVLYRMGNTENFIYGFLGLVQIGACPIMLRPGNRAEEARELAEQTSPTLLITMDQHLGEDAGGFIRHVRETCPTVEHVLRESEIAEICRDSSLVLDDQGYEPPSVEDRSHFLLSGGTTGTPKIVAVQPTVLLYSAACYADRGSNTPDDRCLVAIPASHNFTMCVDIFSTFVSGGTVVMCNEASPVEILRLIGEERITHLTLVPALARLCIEFRREYDGDDISHLRYISEGGAEVTADLVRDGREVLGCQTMNCYGMTEGFYGSTYLDDDDEMVCQGLNQGVMPGYVLRVVDGKGEEVPVGELGEFQFKGAIRFPEYHNNPEATAEALTEDGFYHTGDLGFITEDGYVAVRGRVKDQINRGGESIMPEAVESDLRKHPLVMDCIALGVPDDTLGQRIAAFIISSSTDLDQLQLLGDLRDMNISEHHIPDDVVFVDSFPQTPSQKIDRKALLASFQERR